MRFVATTDGKRVNDFAVVRRTGIHVHDDEFIRAVAESLDAKCPDVDKFLLAFDAGQIRRGTGFIGAAGNCRGDTDAEQNGVGTGDK